MSSKAISFLALAVIFFTSAELFMQFWQRAQWLTFLLKYSECWQVVKEMFDARQSAQSLCLSPERTMIVKLLTEHQLEILCFKGGRTCSFECTLVKVPHCWKSHVTAHFCFSSGGHFWIETVNTIDERISKSLKKFDCHKSPNWRQKTIKITVSSDFWSVSSIVKSVFDCRRPGVLLSLNPLLRKKNRVL